MSQTASSINYRLGSLYSVITAFLYATQEPFSFPAAKHLNTLQFVALTQVSLLVSIPLLMSRSKSRRDFVALVRKPINYGYLGIIFAIGLTGLLLYNFGLSNAHPIIISAILNLSPFWAALVALVLAGVPIPISRATFFGCFAGAFIGAMAVAWSQLGDAAMSNISQLTDSFLHGSWLYAIPVPLASALGGTLVGKWFGAYDESAAIAANFLTANVILIPGCLALLYWRNELNFDQLGPILLMIFGTIVAASLGPGHVSDRADGHGRRQRLCHHVPQPGPGADGVHIARAVALGARPALRHRSGFFSRLRLDRRLAGAVFAEIVAAAGSASLNAVGRCAGRRGSRGSGMSQTASSINYRLGSLYSVVTAFLYATQEPFSFPAARHLNTLQFVCLTQIALLVSIPFLTAPPLSRRDFLALIREPSNYGPLAIIFAIGMSGLLLYNFGLSNAHPIIISAILNLSPFWGAMVALVISRVPIPISSATFFGCFAGAFIGAMAVAWSQLSDANKPALSELADNFVHGSWVYAIPVPLCSALGGTLVGKWFAKYNKSAAIAANFLAANVILIPGCLAILYWRNELQFVQLQAIILMIVGTILASAVGRVFYQISLTVTGGDNGFVTMFWNLVPALTALVSLILSRWIADEHFAINPTFFVGSGLIAASLMLFSLKSWRQPARQT